MAKPVNAAMSTEDLWEACQEAVDGAMDCMSWVVSIYPLDRFMIVAAYDDEVCFWKIPFTPVAKDADNDEGVTIDIEAKQQVERKWLYEGTNEIAASKIKHLKKIASDLRHKTARFKADRIVATGSDAAAMVDDLVAKNPLFAALKGTPNAHFTVFDLTTVGRPSQHAGSVRFQLSKKGMAASLPTIIAKPIHVTADMEGHIDGDPKPIGACLGLFPIEEAADGSVMLRAIGSLWSDDFPDEVEEIAANKAILGASYELQYDVLTATAIAPGVVELNNYAFGGCAILKKSAAAYPETSVLVATDGPRRIRPERKEVVMAARQYPGFTAEQEPAIAAIIAAALDDYRTEMASKGALEAAQSTATQLQRELEASKAEVVTLTTRAEAAETKVTALEADLVAAKATITEQTAQIEAAKAEKLAADAARVKAENAAQVETMIKDVATAKKLELKDVEPLRPIFEKQVAGQALTHEELGKLMALSGPSDVRVPLFAHREVPAAGAETDVELTKKNFPALRHAPRTR